MVQNELLKTDGVHALFCTGPHDRDVDGRDKRGDAVRHLDDSGSAVDSWVDAKHFHANLPLRNSECGSVHKSQPMNSRPRRRQAVSTPKPPAAGSITRSLGNVTAAISRSTRPCGLICGWILRSTFSDQWSRIPWSRHVARARIGGFC